MYKFLTDARDALLLRFQRPEHYRYNAAVVCGILVVLGLVAAAGQAPMLGNGNAFVALALVFTVAKWLVLSVAMRLVLGYYSGTKTDWKGYVLVTDALVIPVLITLYSPDIFEFPAMLWQSWIMVVQLIGFARIANVGILKVLAGYLVYLLFLLPVAALLLSVFSALGWIDLQSMMQHLQAYSAQMQNGQ